MHYPPLHLSPASAGLLYFKETNMSPSERTEGKIILVTPTRRLITYPYGWKVERLYTPEEPTKKNPDMTPYWKEDAPAWPGTLAQGLYMAAERHIRENGDTDLPGLMEQVREAEKSLQGLKVECINAAKGLEDE
jgi:hypothetical protein